MQKPIQLPAVNLQVPAFRNLVSGGSTVAVLVTLAIICLKCRDKLRKEKPRHIPRQRVTRDDYITVTSNTNLAAAESVPQHHPRLTTRRFPSAHPVHEMNLALQRTGADQPHIPSGEFELAEDPQPPILVVHPRATMYVRSVSLLNYLLPTYQHFMFLS